MDPTAALRGVLEALIALEARHSQLLPDEQEANTAEEREQAVDCLLELAGWLRGGGFPPDVDQAVSDAGYDLELPEGCTEIA